MKNRRSKFSNLFILVILVGLIVTIIAVFNSSGLRGVGSAFSPLPTAVDSQASPLPTPAGGAVPLARVEPPIQLQASGPLGLMHQSPDKVVNIAGEKGTVLLDLASGLTRTLATTALINAYASDHWLVYEDRPPVDSPNQYSRVKVIDLDSGKEILLGNENSNQHDPQVSGNIVVWDEARNGKTSSRYAHDLATGQTFTVSVKEGVRGYPRISGQWIVYIQWPDRNSTGWETLVELRAYSLETHKDWVIGSMPITKDSWALTRYAIDGDKVAWTKYDPNQFWGELHLYDLKTRTDRQLTEPNNFLPAGLSVSAKSGIVVYNDTGQRIVLDWFQPTPARLSITPTPEIEQGYELSVSGDYLVWEIPGGQIFVTKVVR